MLPFIKIYNAINMLLAELPVFGLPIIQIKIVHMLHFFALLKLKMFCAKHCGPLTLVSETFLLLCKLYC